MSRTMASLVVLLLISCGVGTAQTDSPHLIFGNPSKASADPGQKDNFLMVKKEFALSYNDSTGTPNWVSWRLRKEDLGNAARKPFHPDDTLPAGFTRVKPSDYKYSMTAMTRGHLCPHSDRSNDAQSSSATFVMTNMVPQTTELNAGAWNDLENYLRNQVKDGHKEAYIVAGPWGKGGQGARGLVNTTNGKVVVPSKCWKVALLIDSGTGSAMDRVNDNTALIGSIMPNNQDPERHKWTRYPATITELEHLTGFKFFDQAPTEAIKRLKGLTHAEAAGID